MHEVQIYTKDSLLIALHNRIYPNIFGIYPYSSGPKDQKYFTHHKPPEGPMWGMPSHSK